MEVKILIPPKEILDPAIGKSWEHIILWMLAKNKQCEWANFIDNISIPLSSLSTNLKSLREDGYIVRPERNQYEITQDGLERLRELEYLKKHGKRALNFPPKTIVRKRNYTDWILWMLFNNDYCKWSDFTGKPLKINSSSLSNAINSLKKDTLIVNENSEYRITAGGKIRYFEILKRYDLDRQSILEEESRRIEEITRNTNEFFEKYGVQDSKVKFRFLNNILKLNYSKVENLLNDEENFNKIILFLSFNHPNYFPNYISIDKFANEYGIKRTILEFFLEKIVEEEFYTVKFHKLEVIPDKEYYFQANSKLERVLRAIVDDKITRFTYLNKLQETSSEGAPSIKIDIVFEEIINEICVNLFQEELKFSLKNFLPEYIKYLAYKIESETKLINTDAKLESIIIQAAMEDLKSYNVTPIKTESGKIEYNYKLDTRIFETLDGFYLDKLMLLKDKDFAETYNLTGIKYYQQIIKGLKKGSDYQKLKSLIESMKDDLSDLQKLILDDILYTYHNEFEKSLKTSEKISDSYPDQPVGFLFHSLTHLAIGDFNEAVESLKDTEGITHQKWLICQKAQVLSKTSKLDLANEILDKALEKDPDNIFFIRTKIVVNIGKIRWSMEDQELLFNLVDKGLELSPNNLDLKMLKASMYCMIEKYKEAKRFLDKELSDYYYDENYPSVGTSCLFMRAFSYTARGKYEKAMKDAQKSMVHYEDHYTAFTSKALVLGYNLIFNFEPNQNNEEEFIELIGKAITSAPNKGTQSLLLSFKASVFHELGNVKEALNNIDNALVLAPEDIRLHQQKVYILSSSNKKLEAIDLIDYIIEQFEEGRFKMLQTKSVIYYQMKEFESALKANDEMINQFPKNQYESKYASILNNRALILAELDRKEEAIETAKEMIACDKKDGNLRDSFGEILLIVGDYEDSIKQFEEAIAMNPTGWYIDQSYIKMGLCYLNLGEYERAKENFEIGKDLWEKKPPKERTIYDHNPDVYLMELKEKMKES
ncbi:MAG: hypothetical protein ACTSXM_10135 [Promethearchaeota archaeon]